MALPASGPISLGDVNVELGLARTLTIDLGATGVRTLYNVPTGAIRLAEDGYGKANRVALSSVFSANTTQTTVTASSVVGYVAGKTDLTITINAGVIITSTSTATSALTITGAAAGDTITIVNNGYIFGMGGAGGRGGGIESGNTLFLPIPGSPGGPAIQLTSLTGISLTVRNRGVLAGGSGGGGGGGWGYSIESDGFNTYDIVAGGSGGGGGITNGAGGIHGMSRDAKGNFRLSTTSPGAGTPPAYTFGVAQTSMNFGGATTGGRGGNGGALGSAGLAGAQGIGSQNRSVGAIGGLAGKAINLNGAVYTAAATAVTLSSVVIGAGGTFTCAATTIRFGQKVTITGTNTGTGGITGYVSGNVYYVIATNGSTTFTLSATWNGTAIASTAGTPVGLTFSLDGTTAGVIS